MSSPLSDNCCLPPFAQNAPAGPTPPGIYVPEGKTQLKMAKTVSKLARLGKVNHRIVARVPRRRKQRYF